MLSKISRKLVSLALCLGGANALATESVSPQRREELVYLLHQDCGSCHGMRLSGGLGPSLESTALAGKPASYLRRVIALGVPDKAMPPWGDILAPAEIDFLVERLRNPPQALGSAP